MDLVIIMSIFPALQSAIMRLNSSLFFEKLRKIKDF